MRMTLLFRALLTLAVLSEAARADTFDKLKESLRSAACISVDFLSIVSSDVFESTDSTVGSAYLGRDGRYQVRLGPDQYVFDGALLYSISTENNQVVIDSADTADALATEVSFLARLDEFYTTRILEPNRQYLLGRLPGAPKSIPDSMHLWLRDRRAELERLTYRDDNGDPVTLEIRRLRTSPACDNRRFIPDLPPTMERIRR